MNTEAAAAGTQRAIDRAATEAFTSEGGRPVGAHDDRTLAELGIAFDGRDYRFDGYRYQHLQDALNYAQLQRERRGLAV